MASFRFERDEIFIRWAFEGRKERPHTHFRAKISSELMYGGILSKKNFKQFREVLPQRPGPKLGFNFSLLYRVFYHSSS